VVEDDPEINELVGAYVQLAGFEYRRALTGAAALAEFTRRTPAVVVLDVMLPDLDGFEVCRRIRALPGGARVRLVALTTWGTVQDRRSGADAGFDEHWTKPMGLELFRDLTRRQLLAAAR
jgi:DNA-binding response OmpR family regulator